MSRNWGPTAAVMLSLCKTVDKRMWSFQHPLLQFTDIPMEIQTKIDKLPPTMSIEFMKDMDSREIGQSVRHVRMGDVLYKCVHQFPSLHLEAEIAPITRTVLRITLYVTPGNYLITSDFKWSDKVHGKAEGFWIW